MPFVYHFNRVSAVVASVIDFFTLCVSAS